MNKSMMDKFQKCYRCQETDTCRIYLGTSDEGVIYVGWCESCNREYSYRERIIDVHDKEKRI